MSNISISELKTEITELNSNDLILVSKKNGDTFSSAKMKAGVITNSFSSDCQNVLSELGLISAAITSLTTKVDNIQTTQNTHTQYLANLTDLNTRIGNKIFSGTYGDNKTLTLNTSLPTGCTLTAQPTMEPDDGTYPSGTRVVITAYNPTDTLNYQFIGWYQGTALVSNQQSYSYEVTSNVTLTAKYGAIQRTITVYYKIVNNSSYIIGPYSNDLNKWIYEIEPGKSKETYSTATYSGNNWSTAFYCIIDAKNTSTGKPVTGTLPINGTTTYGNVKTVTSTTYPCLGVEATGTPPSNNLVFDVVITVTNK